MSGKTEKPGRIIARICLLALYIGVVGLIYYAVLIPALGVKTASIAIIASVIPPGLLADRMGLYGKSWRNRVKSAGKTGQTT